jgi:hypothetical protein
VIGDSDSEDDEAEIDEKDLFMDEETKLEIR